MRRVTVRWIGVILFFVSIWLMYTSYVHDTEKISSLLGNLGTELLGIVITVLVIDTLNERRQTADEVKQEAWKLLLELDHLVWVWQGGKRGFSREELIYMMEQIDEHEIPPYIQNLIIRMASRAYNYHCRREFELRKISKNLLRAFNEIASLECVRDNGRLIPNADIVEKLKIVVEIIVQYLEIPKLEVTEQMEEGFESTRNPSLEEQKKRHFGIEEIA